MRHLVGHRKAMTGWVHDVVLARLDNVGVSTVVYDLDRRLASYVHLK